MVRGVVGSPMSLPDLSQLPLNEHRALVLHRQARRAVFEAWEAWEEAAKRYRQLVERVCAEELSPLPCRVFRPRYDERDRAAMYANRKLDVWIAAQAREEAVFQQVRQLLPSEGVLRPPAGRVYERFPMLARGLSDSDRTRSLGLGITHV